MRTPEWDRERFGATLEEIRKRAQLTPADIARFAGRSPSQVSRWTRSENQPGYDGIHALATAIAARYPDLADLTRTLLVQAGYGGSAVGKHASGAGEPAPISAAETAHSPPAKAERSPAATEVMRGLPSEEATLIGEQLIHLIASVSQKVEALETDKADKAETRSLREQIAELKQQIDDLRDQNGHSGARSA